MGTYHKVRKRLSDEDMANIHELTLADPQWGWVFAVVKVFLCFGIDVTDADGPDIKPWDYAIPKDQWETICRWCMPKGSDIGRVNHALDWMNKGPSSYEESAA